MLIFNFLIERWASISAHEFAERHISRFIVMIDKSFKLIEIRTSLHIDWFTLRLDVDVRQFDVTNDKHCIK